MRIPYLDFYRFTSAILVVLFHYAYRGWALDSSSLLQFEEIGNYFKYGYTGVYFFFMISGVVIAMSAENVSMKVFFVKRLIRLYPIFWFSVIITGIFIGQDLWSLLANLTMIPTYLGFSYTDGVYWSLLVELKFYFIIGLIIYLKRYYKNIRLINVAYCWIILSIMDVLVPNSPLSNAISSILILDYASLFASGIIFFEIWKNRQITRVNIAFIILAYTTQLFLETGWLQTKSINYMSEFEPMIAGLILGLFFLLIYLSVMSGKRKVTWVQNAMGGVTYPLYLLHQELGYELLNNYGGIVNKNILLIITIVFFVAISYLIWRYIESPVISWLKAILVSKKSL